MDLSHDIMKQIGEEILTSRNHSALLGELTKFQEEWENTSHIDSGGRPCLREDGSRIQLFPFFKLGGSAWTLPQSVPGECLLEECPDGEYSVYQINENLEGEEEEPCGNECGDSPYREPQLVRWVNASKFRAMGHIVVVRAE
jgi:hypothetical protein|tara:strand:- start:16 stop:441 length:426 start_codon:yes stop_codon:yes gene_type:complete